MPLPYLQLNSHNCVPLIKFLFGCPDCKIVCFDSSWLYETRVKWYQIQYKRIRVMEKELHPKWAFEFTTGFFVEVVLLNYVCTFINLSFLFFLAVGYMCPLTVIDAFSTHQTWHSTNSTTSYLPRSINILTFESTRIHFNCLLL